MKKNIARLASFTAAGTLAITLSACDPVLSTSSTSSPTSTTTKNQAPIAPKTSSAPSSSTPPKTSPTTAPSSSTTTTPSSEGLPLGVPQTDNTGKPLDGVGDTQPVKFELSTDPANPDLQTSVAWQGWGNDVVYGHGFNDGLQHRAFRIVKGTCNGKPAYNQLWVATFEDDVESPIATKYNLCDLTEPDMAEFKVPNSLSLKFGKPGQARTENIGTVQPSNFALSDHMTMQFRDVTWRGWGSVTAAGTGQQWRVPEGKSTAEGHWETVHFMAHRGLDASNTFTYVTLTVYTDQQAKNNEKIVTYDLRDLTKEPTLGDFPQ